MRNRLTCTLVALAIIGMPSMAMARDQIKIVGSSTVYPFATVVAERFGKNGKFKTPVIESTGTGGGMKLFCGGVGAAYPDITNASRAIKDSEVELCKSNGVDEIVEVVVGNDGIAFANSTSGLKLNFTQEQLWLAMAKEGPKPDKWSSIDPTLPDVAIKILTPPPTSGTRDAWNSLIMKKGCPKEILAKENGKDLCMAMREDGPVVEAGENDALMVQKLAQDPASFGIFGFSYLDANRDKIQASTINNIAPTLETIQSYEYPVARPLFFYLKKAHVGVVPGLEKFLEEFTSQAAMSEEGYLSEVGLVPLDSKKMIAVRKTVKSLKTIQ